MDYYESAGEKSEIELSQEVNEDRDELKKCRQSLGLTRKYVPSWTARDAFREFFQNWMDGMVQSSKVSPRSITLAVRDTDKEWIATAHGNGSDQVLGFIRFVKAKGSLELTNFGARLSRKSLDLGASSKRDTESLAGTHGEGFKVASLVMVRKGYQVRYESAKYYWSFQFGGREKSHLYCHLTPMKDTKVTQAMLADAKRRSAGKVRELKGNIWEDVTVKIGKVYNSSGKEIDFDLFQEWIKISFALHRPANTITTPHGDLVLGVEFSNRIYLQGLYLGDSNASKRLKFGYNLLSGDVNRDRERLSGEDEEASILAKIWAAAIDANEQNALKEYTQMLLEDDEKNWADINLASKKLSLVMVYKIWTFLGKQDPEHKSFFYHAKTREQDVTSIERHLKKHAKPLPSCLWEPFKRWKLVRTPQEQRHFLLANAPITNAQATPYSNSFMRVFSAALGLDERTRHLNLVFKSGTSADLDLLLDGNNLLINDKWLDFKANHRKASCWLSRLGIEVGDFSCDHIIYDLHCLVMTEFKKHPNTKPDQQGDSTTSLRLEVAESLRQMPRSILVQEGDHDGELNVSWTVVEEDLMRQLYKMEMKCRVTLHRESTCSDKRTDVLFLCGDVSDLNPAGEGRSDPEDEAGTAACGCPYQIASQKDGRCVFKNLDMTEQYFAMVARNYDRAFFGVPPSSINPAKTTVEERNGVHKSNTSSGPAELKDKQTLQQPDTESTPQNSSLDDDDDSEEASSPALLSQSSLASTGTQLLHTATEDTNTQAPMSPVSGCCPDRALISQEKPRKAVVPDQGSQDQHQHLSLRRLDDVEGQLDSARQELEVKDLELRQAKSDIETQKQKLTSIIEDLRGEVEQLQENYSESEKQLKEVTGNLDSLRAESQQLAAEKAELEVRANDIANERHQTVENPAAGHLQAPDHPILPNEVTELPESVTNKISELEATVESLRDAISRVQEDRTSMTTTLQGVSSMIQGVLAMPTRTLMASTLQGVLPVMQGMLNMGAHRNASATSSKRGRIKEEVEDDVPLVKRPKKGEVISLD